MPLLQVPVIDLSPYRSGTPEGKAAVAAQVDQACRTRSVSSCPGTAFRKR
ncbi:hypothetical protein [Methylobacterium sp. Leaf89]|nr:hypothetical protein [Methylobacterium sp. Leaf89]